MAVIPLPVFFKVVVAFFNQATFLLPLFQNSTQPHPPDASHVFSQTSVRVFLTSLTHKACDVFVDAAGLFYLRLALAPLVRPFAPCLHSMPDPSGISETDNPWGGSCANNCAAAAVGHRAASPGDSCRLCPDRCVTAAARHWMWATLNDTSSLTRRPQP